MFKPIAIALGTCLLAAACSPGANAAPATATTRDTAAAFAPGFTGIDHWINSPPLTMAQLRGKVVLVEFWTYSCINCIHVMPYVKQWHKAYHDQGLVVVGVHTPEYDEEKATDKVRDAVKRFGIEYAVAQDNGYATWNAYSNQFWPAVYLIDKSGRVVYRHYGEGDYAATEARIRQLLAAH
jgi:thiol-disulfide isomerase/thioredoxin